MSIVYDLGALPRNFFKEGSLMTKGLPFPQTRREEYLNEIAVKAGGSLPIPQTREEQYLDYIAKNGSTGGNDGTDGREIELQKGATHIQWRYVGEESWKDLVALADLKGAKGDKGDTGAKGADGFGTKQQYDDIIARLTALESAGTP